jgi:hypothetical protein
VNQPWRAVETASVREAKAFVLRSSTTTGPNRPPARIQAGARVSLVCFAIRNRPVCTTRRRMTLLRPEVSRELEWPRVFFYCSVFFSTLAAPSSTL